MTKLNVIILAGGQSSRFWPLEEKNLFEFFGTPLVVYQIKRYSLFLKRQNYDPNFIVVTNEDNQSQIKNVIEAANLKVTLITQTLPDQSGAVLAALNKVSKEEKILIINSNDIFSETLVTDLLKKIDDQDIILTAKKVQSYFPGGYLVKDRDGIIEKIWEKPPTNLIPGKLDLFRFVFDYYSSKNLLAKALISDSGQLPSYEDAINSVIRSKGKVGLVLNDQPFTSLKYPWHVLEATRIFLDTIKESVVKTENIDPTARIDGQVFISEGVKIGAFTKIIGPCFIGKNTIIGDHVLIRDSHIGHSALVGAHSEVARSYLGNNVMLHRNYVGDSVLADYVSLGANAITANWRFDEQIIKSAIKGEKIETNLYKLGAIIGTQAKIGVNVSLMPGCKITKQAKVKPGTIIFNDLKANE